MDPLLTRPLSQLEQPLAQIEHLPPLFSHQALINSRGPAQQQLSPLLATRDALLYGLPLPEPSAFDGMAQDESSATSSSPPSAPWPAWPDTELLAGFLSVLRKHDLPQLCQGRTDLIDNLLRSFLWHTDHIPDYQDMHGDGADTKNPSRCTPEEARQRALQAFDAEWHLTTQEVQTLVDVFLELGDLMKHNRWGEVRGLLSSDGWQDLIKIRKLLEDLPELRQIIKKLGRAELTDEPDPDRSPDVPAFEKRAMISWELREQRSPDMPGETRGVERSGRIARMLPSESIALHHPKLRKLLLARIAERTLLTYREQAVYTERVPVVREVWMPSNRQEEGRRLQMGPIILCVDTSGSMQGAAERVAKAAVLEAMRVAHQQKRRCYLVCFSGPDDIIERELSLDVDGLQQMLSFITQSHHGGTDITGPIERALARITTEGWRLADLLIASDGEFGATPAVAKRLRAAKTELGLRVQGVLIGDRETIGLRELADHILWIKEWRKYAILAEQGATSANLMMGATTGITPRHNKLGSVANNPNSTSPLPTMSLTAQYFPNALRTPQQQVRDGFHGADAVRGLTGRDS